MESEFQLIKQAIEDNELEKARQLLRPMLQNEPSSEVYYWASKVSVDQQQRQTFLEKAIELDPFHAEARKELKFIIDGDGAKVLPQKPVEVTEPKNPSNEMPTIGTQPNSKHWKTVLIASPIVGLVLGIFQSIPAFLWWIGLIVPSIYIGRKSSSYVRGFGFGLLATFVAINAALFVEVFLLDLLTPPGTFEGAIIISFLGGIVSVASRWQYHYSKNND